MNLQPQLKKISIPPPCIALAFVVVTALIVAPTLLGEGTQHREGPPDATVSGYFGRMFRICRHSRRQRMRFATLLWSLVGWVGFWMRTTIWQRVLWR